MVTEMIVPEGCSYLCFHCAAKVSYSGEICYEVRGVKNIFWIHRDCKNLTHWTKDFNQNQQNGGP